LLLQAILNAIFFHNEQQRRAAMASKTALEREMMIKWCRDLILSEIAGSTTGVSLTAKEKTLHDVQNISEKNDSEEKKAYPQGQP
jgi:hypothetical protein